MTLSTFPVIFVKTRLTLVFLLVLASVHMANGQEAKEEASSDQSIRKGKVLLGSYFDFSKSTIDRTRTGRSNSSTDVLSVGINITGGKMLSDHWGLLLIAGYSQASKVTPFTVAGTSFTFEERTEDYSFAPAVRYYKLIGDATYFFLQGGVFVSRGTSQADEFDGTSIVQLDFKTSGFGAGISPGFSYFMTDKLSTEISIGLLGYSIFTGEDDKGNKTVSKTFQSLLYLNSVSLGFVYYL